ncbi:MAG: NAD(P)-binding domain-containing protein [Planctomycetota bacterium]
MDLPLVVAIVAFVLLLLIVARLQRRVTAAKDARLAAEVREAQARGSHKPLAQHPLIDPARCVGCGSCVKACPEGDVLGLLHGRAVIVHGARCVGHGLCAEACPVGALAVGLGDLAQSKDVPRLTEELETSVPGLFVSGELGGLALIRNAVEQGVAVVERLAQRLSAGAEPALAHAGALDLLISGAGPAGIAAALAAKERGLRYVAVEQEESLGGSILHYPRRKLTMLQSFTLPLHGKVKIGEYPKEAVLSIFENAVTQHSLPIHFGERVLAIERRVGPSPFRIATTKKSWEARYVLMALGRRGTPRKLEVPGEELPKVTYKLVDAASYSHSRLLVVGGGDSAIEAALALAQQPGNEVTLSYRKSDFYRIKARNEERMRAAIAAKQVDVVLSSNVREITTTSVVLQIESGDGKARELALPNDYVFVFAGGVPPFAILEGAGVAFGPEQARPLDPSAACLRSPGYTRSHSR